LSVVRNSNQLNISNDLSHFRENGTISLRSLFAVSLCCLGFAQQRRKSSIWLSDSLLQVSKNTIDKQSFIVRLFDLRFQADAGSFHGGDGESLAKRCDHMN
jgi:hypothetical protein